MATVAYYASYGHASWYFLVPLAVALVTRFLIVPRRRAGRQSQRPSPSMPAGQFQSSSGPATSTGQAHGIPASWLPDPSGRHEQRFWSGTAWTDHVVDGGVPGTDPFPDLSRHRDEPPPGAEGRAEGYEGTAPGDAPPATG